VNYLAVSIKNTIFAANNRVTIMEATLRPTQIAQPAPKQSSFLSMQGILKGDGNVDTDRRMLDEYIQEKYGV